MDQLVCAAVSQMCCHPFVKLVFMVVNNDVLFQARNTPKNIMVFSRLRNCYLVKKCFLMSMSQVLLVETSLDMAIPKPMLTIKVTWFLLMLQDLLFLPITKWISLLLKQFIPNLLLRGRHLLWVTPLLVTQLKMVLALQKASLQSLNDLDKPYN